jgi:CheY-like chemotaxis protein
VNPDPAATIRVLYAEDAFDQALLVKAFLQAAPGEFHVTHSQDGDHAAELLREKEWGLLITDLNLPGLDGFELCRIARSVRPTLPILAITGYTGAHYQEEAYRAGATELLTKPLDKEEFLRKIEELTGKGMRVEPAGGAAADAAAKDAPAEDAADPAAPTRTTVLAIGGLVGDVEMGCGGTLLKQRQAGADVVVMPLCGDDLDPSTVSAAQEASRRLGARLTLVEAAMADTAARTALLRRVVRELAPRIAFVPAMDDEHPSRREAFRIGQTELASVPLVLGYQTATTGSEFRPTRLEDVREQIVDKMEALTAFQDAGAARQDLAPRMAQAYARYWGRLQGFSEVEAFEVVRG